MGSAVVPFSFVEVSFFIQTLKCPLFCKVPIRDIESKEISLKETFMVSSR